MELRATPIEHRHLVSGLEAQDLPEMVRFGGRQGHDRGGGVEIGNEEARAHLGGIMTGRPPGRGPPRTVVRLTVVRLTVVGAAGAGGTVVEGTVVRSAIVGAAVAGGTVNGDTVVMDGVACRSRANSPATAVRARAART
jgi:hypothetical protein